MSRARLIDMPIRDSATANHQRRISRRSFISHCSSAVALAGLATACGQVSSPFPNGARTTAPTTQAKRGGTFIFGTTTPIGSMNPYPYTAASATFWWTAFDTLIRLNDQRQPVPHLAESRSEERL